MDIFSKYKSIKTRLSSLGIPTFFYTGQYQTGKDNTSFVCPAIYIEMPKNLKIDYFPGKLQVAKDAEVKIHVLTSAPYKSQDNSIQDAALTLHNTKLNAMDSLLSGWEIKNNDGKLLASQFILSGENNHIYRGSSVASVHSFKSEFYHSESGGS
jgi:hypothetical protein